MNRLCKDCEHFKIIQEPIKGFDWGMAKCKKHDLVVDFINKGKFRWLSCIEQNNEREEIEDEERG